MTSAKILLVTPVWRDSRRLAVFGEALARALASSDLPIHWVIADDGSEKNEHEALRKLTTQFHEIFPKVELYFAPTHFGKGSVVREAWALYPDSEWLAFVDADGSVTAEEMLRLIAAARDSGKSALGIRKRTATTEIEESPWRGLFHQGFLIAANILLGLRCEDPQCGAKVLRGGDYRQVVARLREKGLAFDSELLFGLKRAGLDWIEVPVNWIQKGGGTVNPLKHSWGMLIALGRIRCRF